MERTQPGQSALTIRNANRAHSGVLACTAHNVAGTETRNVELTVECKFKEIHYYQRQTLVLLKLSSTYSFHLLLPPAASTFTFHLLFPPTPSTYSFHLLLPPIYPLLPLSPSTYSFHLLLPLSHSTLSFHVHPLPHSTPSPPPPPSTYSFHSFLHLLPPTPSTSFFSFHIFLPRYSSDFHVYVDNQIAIGLCIQRAKFPHAG